MSALGRAFMGLVNRSPSNKSSRPGSAASQDGGAKAEGGGSSQQAANAAAAEAAAAATAIGGITAATREKVRKLSLQLADSDGMNRAQAQETIKGLGPEQARAVMQAFAVQLDSQNPLIQSIACRVMANMGNLGAPHVVKIAELVSDEDAGLRRAAANALGLLGKPGVDALVRMRTHENHLVREIVVYEIGAARLVQHVAEVAGMLGDKDVSVRGNAINALMKMGEEGNQYMDKVADLMGDDEGEVRKMAEGMVIQATKSNAKRASSLLRHPEGGARLLAVKALDSLGEEGIKHVDEVARLIGDENEQVDEAAASMVKRACKAKPALAVKMLQHSTTGARRIGTDAVVDMGTDGAEHAGVIVKMLQDSHPKTRLNAVMALSNMAAKGAEHAGEIAKLCSDEDPKVRAAVVDALAGFGAAGQAHAKGVLGLLTDNDPEVRTATSNALRQWAALRQLEQEKEKK
eukprot:TRINITY_DN51434_c0_g1_i1.p1 TRINITY_DN51434_c0_g1~~TRINITY_DN51434_c0_g1_i1.p1  ORF type:complete len:462 (-),score=117.32 TRINITY_DN51434_c0_g1_i1:75-1460(-)